MKRTVFTIIAIAALININISCKKDEPVDVDKGTLRSASYNPNTKSFVLQYSSGQTQTVQATIDTSTEPPTASFTTEQGQLIYVEDATVEGYAKITKDINVVSQFVYDGMSLFYLWADEVKNKTPGIEDFNPTKYFYSILSTTDTEHGWSWITDDVDELMAGFQGEATDAFGFNPLPLWEDNSYTAIIGFVRYVYPNTPAEEAGLKRGEVISKIDGKTIGLNNYHTLYGANRETTFTVLDQNFENPREVKIMPAKINTNPVLFSNIYEIEGKKIGYLFYTEFISNYNESLHQKFAEFKTAGVTDLVLDLRYNPGGGISAATYLASLIAPVSAVESGSPFSIMSYNNYVNSAYDKNDWDRSSYLGSFDEKNYSDPVSANINNGDLNVYVIALGSSASASELLTFCLKPYMNIKHIGEKTSGKYTASWTIHAYKDFNSTVQSVYKESSLSASQKNILKNWAMQPIVGRYTDKNNKDFIATNGLIPDYPIESQEYNTKSWKPIGDPDDYLLAKAISLITGSPYPPAAAAESQTKSSSMQQLKSANLFSPTEKVFRRGVIIDNPKLLPPIEFAK